MKKYRAAVIGCGKIGADPGRYSQKVQPWTHASIFFNHDSTDLVGFMDMDSSRQEKLSQDFPGIPFFTDARQMMMQTKPDIVSVATNSGSHAQIVELVSEYPVKAILCEKPIAKSVAEGERMVAKCKEKGIQLFINHMRRFDPEIRAAKERIKDLGTVMQAQAYYYRGLFNNGTHTVDLLRYFLGDVIQVVAIKNPNTGGNYADLPGEMDVDAMLVFASGAHAALQALDAENYSCSDIIFMAKKGRMGIRHFGFRIEETGLKPCSIFKGHNELDDLAPRYRGEARSLMLPAVTHIIDCLEGRDKSVSTGEDGLAAMRVLEAIARSADEGGLPVSLVK